MKGYEVEFDGTCDTWGCKIVDKNLTRGRQKGCERAAAAEDFLGGWSAWENMKNTMYLEHIKHPSEYGLGGDQQNPDGIHITDPPKSQQLVSFAKTLVSSQRVMLV